MRVDGNDVFAVYAAVKAAVDARRAGGGPTLVEARDLPRWARTASSDDPTRYRDDQTEEWTRKDPIGRFGPGCARGHAPGGRRALRAAIEEELREAIDAEENVGPPPVETLIEDVFAEPTTALREQLADLQRIRAKR